MKQTFNSQTVQRRSEPQVDKHLAQSQGDIVGKATAQKKANPLAQQAVAQTKTNKTGMPDDLKSGIESLSGMDMSDVKVHYNSDKPAQLQAHAYAQGTDIHLASGQEKHLGHEAWHVVQQKQGRVQPTTQMKGTKVNDDSSLESEADVMGAKALQMKADTSQTGTLQNAPAKGNVLQGFFSLIPLAVLAWRASVSKNNTFGKGKKVENKTEKHPEQKAMDSVKNVQRGNKREDIIKSGGKSTADVSFTRDYAAEVRKGLEKELKSSLKNILRGEWYSQAEIDKIMAGDRVEAYVSTVMGAGNCGEFSRLIFWHIMENSENRTVYQAAMAPYPKYDHEFNIVVPDSTGIANDDVATMQANKKVLALDGWDKPGGKPKTLGKFMNTGNPYKLRMKPANVNIFNKGRADKTQRLSKGVKKKIEKITLDLYEKYKKTYLDSGKGVYDKLKAGEDVPGIF